MLTIFLDVCHVQFSPTITELCIARMDYFGFASLFMANIGARFLNIDFTEKQKGVVMHPVTQNVIVFCMFYVATQRVLIATFLWGIFFAFTRILLNENHPLNIYPRDYEPLGRPNPLALYYDNIAKLPKPA